MSLRRWLADPRTKLDTVAGLVDGILNALTLAAGHLVHGGGADAMLIVRVAAATGLTTVFVFFMAHYSELRAELARAERELNLSSHGKLATTQLGYRAACEAFRGALLAAACGVAGSTLSLLLCLWLSHPAWLGLAAVLCLLGVLGALLARSFHGSPLIWSLAIMTGGAALTGAGIALNIAN